MTPFPFRRANLTVPQGNGTQAIIEAAEDPDALLFFSVHLFDSDRD
eukprot:COSAG01_NODE_25823_length_720_cov_0.862559_2_plen_45_part_01